MVRPEKHHLSGMFEIDRDPLADDRLDLTEPPVGFGAVAHQRADLEELG